MGRGLPSKYAKMGFSKGWKAYKKTKVNKGRTTKRKVVGGKKKMAKRRRRRYTSKRRRRYSPKIPMEVAVAGISIPFTPAESGWNSPLDYAMNKDFEGLAASLRSGFLGMKGGRTSTGIDFFGLLNPFDMDTARYTKMLIAAGVVSRIRKTFIRIPFKKVPFIGKYIS